MPVAATLGSTATRHWHSFKGLSKQDAATWPRFALVRLFRPAALAIRLACVDTDRKVGVFKYRSGPAAVFYSKWLEHSECAQAREN